MFIFLPLPGFLQLGFSAMGTLTKSPCLNTSFVALLVQTRLLWVLPLLGDESGFLLMGERDFQCLGQPSLLILQRA